MWMADKRWAERNNVFDVCFPGLQLFSLQLKHSLFPLAPLSAAGTGRPSPLSLILTPHLSEHPSAAPAGLPQLRTQQAQSQFTCYQLDCLGACPMWHDKTKREDKQTTFLPSAEIFIKILKIFDIFIQWHWNYRLTLNRLERVSTQKCPVIFCIGVFIQHIFYLWAQMGSNHRYYNKEPTLCN